SELLFGRTIKTRLDLIRPIPEEEEHKFEMVHSFKVDDRVFFRNYVNKGQKWLRGKIVQLLGSSWLLVEHEDTVVKRHCEQLRPCLASEEQLDRKDYLAVDVPVSAHSPVQPQTNPVRVPTPPRSETITTRSGRVVKPPVRYLL